MDFERETYPDYTYVFAEVPQKSSLPSRLQRAFGLFGHVEIGGSKNYHRNKWLAGVRVFYEKDRFRRYSIVELNYSTEEHREISRAFTLSQARRKAARRLCDIAQSVSKDLKLPIVNFDEKTKLDDIASEIYWEKIRKS